MSSLSHKPNTTHTTIIIQPPNHHHQATQQPSHRPIQSRYHQWNSHTHSIEPPSTSLQKPKSKDPSSTYPITMIKPYNKNPKIQSPSSPSSSHHHQPTQIQRSKNPFIKILRPTRNKGKSSSHTTKIQRFNHHHQPTQIQRSKNPFIKIPKPTRNKGKPSAVKVRESEGRRECLERVR